LGKKAGGRGDEEARYEGIRRERKRKRKTRRGMA
jgi:hypothetical protein